LAFFYGVIGIVHMRHVRHAEAVEAFRHACDLTGQAITLSPDMVHYRVMRAMGLAFLQVELASTGLRREAEETGRQAIEAMQKLAAEFPDVPYYQELLPWTWDLLAAGRRSLGDPERIDEATRQEFMTAEKLAQTFPEVPRYRTHALWARQYLAEFLWRRGQRTEATALFRQILPWIDRVHPTDAAGHDTRAWFLAACPDVQFRDPRRALVLAKKAVALAPGDLRYRSTLGAAHYQAGEFQQAIDLLTAGQDQTEDPVEDFFFLAMAHQKLGHTEEARRWYDKAVQTMKKDQWTEQEYGQLRTEAEQLLEIKQPAK
jgi:tetratricopeptide (TPR) repeat protein